MKLKDKTTDKRWGKKEEDTIQQIFKDLEMPGKIYMLLEWI